MKYLMSAEWWKAAGIRAAKTMFQTGAALVVTQMPGGTVDWVAVGSAVIVAGVVRGRPPQFMIIIPQQVYLFNCL